VRSRCPRRGWLSLYKPWLSGVPATCVSCLNLWIATPLCLKEVHVASYLAMVKCGDLRSQFYANADIYPRFLVWMNCNRHCRNNYLMNLVTESVCMSILFPEATRNISQSAWSKQSWSKDSDWSDQRWTVLTTGASCLSFCR
jgi:hypothetical protein